MSADSANDPEVLQRLRSTPQIQARLAQLGGNEFSLQKALRDEFSPELVRAALTLRDLRQRAAAKFTRASAMWFDSKGLEQATSESVARHKASRFDGRVFDFCCGIGSDSIALAARGCKVHSVDRSSACCLMAQWNADVYSVANHVETICRDIADVKERDGLLHIDPDQRPGSGKRMRRVEYCEPSLDQLLELMSDFHGGGIKLSPASNFGGKFSPECEIELISLDGECREATIWFGELAGTEKSRATALPSGETLAADPLSAWTNVGELGVWLFDPDPAIVRAGLVDVLAERLNLRRLDDAEEYLTGDTCVESPFVRPFEVLESVPNNVKEIRRAVRRQSFGQIEIKCRHIPIQAEVVRRKLPLDGDQPGVLVFARQNGKARAVICRRAHPEATPSPETGAS